ncbi:MAG: hypothetical protein PHZ19_06945, partial [Candidatus Thermoplasmatota archaeon]|nr:hypothetical protein [Candidatus Thermoplasmatota archaeon]
MEPPSIIISVPLRVPKYAFYGSSTALVVWVAWGARPQDVSGYRCTMCPHTALTPVPAASM